MGLPGGLEWHVPLVLVTPAVLAAAGAVATRLVERPWLARAALLPSLVLQVLLIEAAAVADQLAGPAVAWLLPGYGSAVGGAVLVALVLICCRPSRPADGWRRPTPWRYCALAATCLAIPLVPLPALAIPLLFLLHGLRIPWRVRACAPIVIGAAVLLSAAWFVDPRLAAAAGALVHLGAALAVERDVRTVFPVLAAIGHATATIV